MNFEPEQVASALHQSWSSATARQWTEDNPAAGQCNVTVLLVHELFGGELLKTRLPPPVYPMTGRFGAGHRFAFFHNSGNEAAYSIT
jgi:hypothetical protein